MIGIAMNAQNGRTGAAGRQVSGFGREDGWSARLCGCMPNVGLCSRRLGVT